MVHNFVDELSLEVTDWGNVDAEHPSEIAELVVGIGAPLIAAAAQIIAAWITRPKPKPVDNDGLLGVKLKRPDGAELNWPFDDTALAAFLAP